MVECGGLENRWAFAGPVGSNPTASYTDDQIRKMHAHLEIHQLHFDKLQSLLRATLADHASDEKAMRFVWITARPETLEQAPEAGMGNTTRADMLGYASPETSVTLDGSEDFTFDKEFFLLYNKDMDPEIIAAIDTALTELYDEGKIQERQKDAFFIPDFLPSEAARDHLTQKRDTYRQVIDEISSGS